MRSGEARPRTGTARPHWYEAYLRRTGLTPQRELLEYPQMAPKTPCPVLGGNGMRTKLAVLVAGAGLLWAAMPVFAHHSFKVQYDENQLITITGAVTKVIWKNPHVHLFVDVKDAGGKVSNWELELASPNGLLAEGWKVDSLKSGDQVTVTGYRARDGSNLANARKVSLAAR
jgi:hypothetical protein